MKPRNTHKHARHLPLMVCIAMTAAQVAHAGIFADDTAGNAQPTAADNGANTILANGGTSATPFVAIPATVSLTGSIGELAVLQISAPGYSVNNAGMLIGSDHRGIDSINDFTLINSGTIGGGINSEGIYAPSAIITNSGSIFGDDDAVYFTIDGGSITNSGTILGIVGIASDGIVARDNVIIDNQAGEIRGLNRGIRVADDLNLTNAAGASIFGLTNGAIVADNSAEIQNYGRIEATTAGSGIDVFNGAIINNLTTFNPFFPFNAISGGVIKGISTGIVTDNGLIFTNQNLGLVEGNTGIIADGGAVIRNHIGARIIGSIDGIDVGDGADINNGGTITGGTGDGIDADNDLVLNNQGTIQATDRDGVNAGVNADITNSGVIRGGLHGISLAGGPATITNTSNGLIQGNTVSAIIVNSGVLGTPGAVVNNAGRITSNTNAFLGNVGDDVVNLQQGSRVIGDLLGFGGVDKVNFTGGLGSNSLDSPSGSSSNSVLGDVLEFTEINKGLVSTPSDRTVAFIGVPGNGGFIVRTDTININSGGLYINGSVDGHLNALTVINANGSAVGGTGTWDARLNVNSGGFSAGAIPISNASNPLNSIGQLNFTRSVDHAAGTFIRMDIRPDSVINNGVNSDQIRQTGAGNTFDVGGAGLRISATDNNRIIRDGTYNVVDSALAITGTGTFAGIGVQFNNNITSLDTGFIGSEVNDTGVSNKNTVLGQYFTSISLGDGTNVDLVVDHDFAGLPNLSNNQSNLGGALDDSIMTSDALTQDLISSLDYSSLEVVQETLASLDPSGFLDMSSTIVSSNYRVHRLVQDHLAGTRNGMETQQAGPVMTDAKGAMVASAPTMTSSSSCGSVWGAASFDWKDGSGDATADFDGQDASFTAGADYRVAPNVLLGILLDGSRGDYDYDGGSSDIESYRVAIYGTYGSATGIYADFLLGYGSHDLELNRELGGLLSGSSADYSTDASSFQGLATVGYAMQSNQVKHGPFAGLEYQNLDVDGYTQKGAFPIEVDGLDSDSLRALIGYRLDATMDRFKPYASVAYAHEFEDGKTSTTASLPSGASFDVEGGAQDSAFLISVGTGINLMQNLDMSVGYRGEISTGDGIDSHGATLGMNYSF